LHELFEKHNAIRFGKKRRGIVDHKEYQKRRASRGKVVGKRKGRTYLMGPSEEKKTLNRLVIGRWGRRTGILILKNKPGRL